MFGYQKLIQGTCGWSDQSLVSCSRFYPKKSLSASEKLSFYSRESGFGCVEVDSSTYAIPSVMNVQSWINATPKEFIFHFKAFGLLVSKSIQYNHLPRSIKDQLTVNTSYTSGNKYITLDVLGNDLTEQLWTLFNNSVLPAYNANKLGIIVFQFQLNVTPNDAAREHITHCAEMLDQRYKMAVEFRNRSWISEEQLSVTIAFLKTLRANSGGVALICCDDLEHEVYMKEDDVMLLLESNANNQKKQTSASVTTTAAISSIVSATNTTSTTPLDIDKREAGNHPNVTSSSGAEDGSSSSTIVNNSTSNINKSTSAAAAACKPLPIILDLEACPFYVYIRVHRRYGSHRVLAQWEIDNWVQRLNQASSCSMRQVVNNNSNSVNVCITNDASKSSTADSQSPNHNGCISDDIGNADNNNHHLLQGPIYFLWGTDHEDQPILNAYNLQKALLDSESKLVDVNDRKIFSYKNKIEGSGSIKSMFAKMTNNTSSTSKTNDSKLSTIVSNITVTDQSSISAPMSPTSASGEESTKKRKIMLSSPVGNSKSSIENYFNKK